MIYEQLPNGTLHLTDHQTMDYIDYWGNGRSTITEQRWNLEVYTNNGVTKVDSILKSLKGKSLLEIGAAPGSLLKKANELGFKTTGVEPDGNLINDIIEYSSSNMIQGYFPNVKFGNRKYDNIVAMDVFEHIEDGQAFIDKCRSLLTADGQIIFMIPFAEDGESMQCNEHIWLYSRQHIEEWLKPTSIETWLQGHHIVIFK